MRSARAELPHLLGALLAIAVYVALHAAQRPLFIYLPIERAFVWSAPEGAVTMKLFGYIAGGLAAYGLGQLAGRSRALVTWFAASRPLATLRTTLAVTAACALVYFVVFELAAWT